MQALEFNGNGTEYFKIWIVNILLTIITLGIYYPWAKVRSRRYFFGNTELDNANFEYHATGKQLFFSFLIAMALFAVYVILSSINPVLSLILVAVLMLAAPWIIWRSIKFNLRMISYRNVRFGFDGALGGSYTTFLAYPNRDDAGLWYCDRCHYGCDRRSNGARMACGTYNWWHGAACLPRFHCYDE